jgi:DnaJ domain
MPQLASSEAFVLFANATVLAGLLVLPALVAGYAKFRARVHQIGTDFWLGKLESDELDRAVLLYKGVTDRRSDIQRQCAEVSGTLLARYRQRRSLRKQFAEERHRLGAYAAHLRSNIIRLRRGPIHRFTSWAHATSSYFAHGCGLVLYAAAWAALIAVYQPDHPAWQAVTNDLHALLQWEPVDVRLLCGNLVAASLALAAMPMLYGFRRITIRSYHGLQLRDLREFAATDPDLLIAELPGDEGFDEDRVGHEVFEAPPLVEEETAWFDVLDVSPWASLEEIKQAYKALIKQNHPDRVHGMSPAFRELAERETRRLNVAYEEAVASLRQRVGSAYDGIQHADPAHV